jgi:oligoribonuclease NrnB/cAMP/cGMP phosphodiesterase (DHH superfamily)
MGIVDGSLTPPPKAVSDSKIGQLIQNDEYIIWLRKDQLVLSWLISSISKQICSQLLDLTSAHSIWEFLEGSFATQSKARVFQYKSELASLKKGDMSINDFVNKAKALSINLAVARKTLDKDD